MNRYVDRMNFRGPYSALSHAPAKQEARLISISNVVFSLNERSYSTRTYNLAELPLLQVIEVVAIERKDLHPSDSIPLVYMTKSSICHAYAEVFVNLLQSVTTRKPVHLLKHVS